MDRHLHPKYYPKCPRNIGLVDQYSWTDKDTNEYTCQNGISHPIYDCNGWIQFSLPLDMYPPINDIHPQIKMTKKMHLNWRESEQQLNDLSAQYYKPGEDYRNLGESLYNDQGEGPLLHNRPAHPQLKNDIRNAAHNRENYRFEGFYGNTSQGSSCGRM